MGGFPGRHVSNSILWYISANKDFRKIDFHELRNTGRPVSRRWLIAKAKEPF